MASGTIRRLSAFLLTLALVVGFAAHGVKAAHMGAAMAAVATDPAMPDGCGGCDGDGRAALACSALCAGYVATVPVPVSVDAIENAFRHGIIAVAGVGLRGPPDPFPPKPSVLT